MDEPFLHTICPLVADVLGDAFPEISENMKTIQKVVHLEEERFVKTLDQGLLRLAQLIEESKNSGLEQLPGAEAFRLYDTFGFPLDLSQDIAAESGLKVDVEGFNLEMEKQKDRARASWSGSGSQQVSPLYRDLLGKVGTVVFTGYDEELTEGTIVAGLASGDELLESYSGDGEIEIVLDRTPFYGESGGQVGDTGTLTGKGFKALVLETAKPLPDLVIHRCRIEEGTVNTGDSCTAEVDHLTRSATRRNHTATHLLHAALKKIVGEHVQQSGSLVEPERFRFDFTHFEALTNEEVVHVEDVVNANVLDNIGVVTRVMTPEEAVEEGAVALFGEKYGDKVRVVTVPEVSMELCGGTHVSRTGDIGLFKITQEGSVAAGVRRIEGITGTGVLERLRNDEEFLRSMAGSMKVSVPELPGRMNKLQETIQEQDLKIKELMASVAGGGSTDLQDEIREESGIRYLAAELNGQDAGSLRDAADRMRNKIGSGVILLATREGGKVALVVAVTKDLMDRYPAGEFVKRLAPIVGGGGGGRPDMAQAGGKNPDGLPQLLDAVSGVIRELSQ
jgi:alanyl-tRNA synthetase